MKFLGFALNNWGFFLIPYLLIHSIYGISLAFFTNFIAQLPASKGVISIHLQIQLVLIFAVFALTPLMTLWLGRVINRWSLKALTPLLNHNNHVNASIAGRCFLTVFKANVLPFSLVQVPLTTIIYGYIVFDDVEMLGIVLGVSLLPMMVVFALGRQKRANAKKLFTQQNIRANRIDHWVQQRNKQPLPNNFFDDELKVRKTESWIDESETILPALLILMITLLLWGSGVINLDEAIRCSIVAHYGSGALTDYLRNITEIVKAEQAYISLLRIS